MTAPPMFEWPGLVPHADIWMALQRAMDSELVSDYFTRLSAARESIEGLLKASLLKAIKQSEGKVQLELTYSGISNSPEEGYTQLIGPNLRLGGTNALVDNTEYEDVTVCGYGGIWQGVQRVDRPYE
ncbi:Hypothetical protein DHA2_31617 [Giardia duodenalis]|uniref:Uncharacterized protein n=1 Tax=Giardia intestinalis TaxID=5741 RepID=V6TKN5_GIAIN|nr:Hypothetical protein DHA2_31617 [Giardia intestinalis]